MTEKSEQNYILRGFTVHSVSRNGIRKVMSVKVRWMTRSTPRGELGNAYKILVGKLTKKKIKRPLVRHPCGLEDNIKTCNCYVRFDCF